MEDKRNVMSYLDFAENDYMFFHEAYASGLKYGTLASIGQNICEKYLKHIVDVLAVPQTNEEDMEKENVLRTHSLRKLIRYIGNNMGICISQKTEDAIDRIDGYYYTTRYPGEDSFFANEKDVEKVNEAVELTRNETLLICRKYAALKD